MLVRLFAVLVMVSSTVAWAQAPSSEVTKIVVAYSAGTTMDVSARILARSLQSELGNVFIVENRPGAAGRIGAEFVARSKPDGHTLFISGVSTHSTNPSLFKKLNYDPVKDFTPISRIASFPYILVTSPKKPFKTFRDFVQYAKDNPGKLNFGYGSATARVATIALARNEGFTAVGVPYPGQSPAITDLISGQTDFVITDLSVSVPHIQAGSLIALALLADERSKSVPEVPTVQESGSPRFSLSAWMGVSAPAGVPPEVAARLSAAINKILGEAQLREQLEKLGMDISPNSPSDFQSFVESQLAVWSENVRAAGIQPE